MIAPQFLYWPETHSPPIRLSELPIYAGNFPQSARIIPANLQWQKHTRKWMKYRLGGLHNTVEPENVQDSACALKVVATASSGCRKQQSRIRRCERQLDSYNGCGFSSVVGKRQTVVAEVLSTTGDIDANSRLGRYL
jgi:hypothetical protein